MIKVVSTGKSITSQQVLQTMAGNKHIDNKHKLLRKYKDGLESFAYNTNLKK